LCENIILNNRLDRFRTIFFAGQQAVVVERKHKYLINIFSPYISSHVLVEKFLTCSIYSTRIYDIFKNALSGEWDINGLRGVFWMQKTLTDLYNTFCFLSRYPGHLSLDILALRLEIAKF